MPSPPRSLEEAVQRARVEISRGLYYMPGESLPGEAKAQAVVDALGLPALLERLQEVERERAALSGAEAILDARVADLWRANASAEARVVSLEEALRQWLAAYTDCAAGGVTFHAAGKAQTTRLVEADEKARKALAQGAAAPLPGDTG